MAKTIKTKTITLSEKQGTFSIIFHRFKGKTAQNTEVANLRHLLSNERARLLHTIKTKKPASIYELTKLLRRDFKAIRQDIRLLEHFGLIEIISSHKKGRERLRPVVDVDKIIITINV